MKTFWGQFVKELKVHSAKVLQDKSWLRRPAQLVFVIVPLAFIFKSLVMNWQDILSYELRIDGLSMGLALISLTGAFCLLPLASQKVLSGFGYSLAYRATYHGYFIAQLAKYLPGGLWVIPGRVMIFKNYGVNAISASAGIVVEMCVLLVAGILVFVPYLFFIGTGPLPDLWTPGVLLILPIILGLHPSIFNRLMNWILSLFGYEDLTVSFSLQKVATILLIDLVFWLAVGVGFYFLITSILNVPFRMYIVATSAFSMAWILGFLAFFIPGGLGVREGSLALLLSPFLPAPLPAVSALLARIWWMLAEMISFIVTTRALKNLKGSEISPPTYLL
jgi:hypothetical protein